MGSQTPSLAIPYPVGTDLIADGDNAIQALAERVEALLLNSLFAAWINVGSGGTAPAFAAGWANYAGGFAPAAFTKIGKLVYMRGLVSATSAQGADAAVFTLPVGYRPVATHMFSVAGSAGNRLDVTPAGKVSMPTNAIPLGGYVPLFVPPFATD